MKGNESMSKNWQYASLGAEERLDLIKNGNEDVYLSEKKRSSSLKDLKKSLGLSTSDIDRWDEMVEDARKRYTSGSLLTDDDVSALSGSRTQSVSSLLNKELAAIRDNYDVSGGKAIDNAEKKLEDIFEWLSANGYSAGSNAAKKAKSDVQDELIKTLKLLESDYRLKSAKALAAAISKFN